MTTLPHPGPHAAPRLTAIIPTLNEAAYLAETVTRLRAGAGASPEIVVSDCGSTDGTAELARDLEVDFLAVDPGLVSRAAALAAGCSKATGEVLLFVDADTLVPAGYDLWLGEALADPAVVGGAFEMRFREPDGRLAAVAALNRLRYRLNHLFYGDQGLFVRREALAAVGGVPPLPVLESAELCRRLKRLGRLALVDASVETSGRRFLDHGVGRVLLLDTRLWLRFLRGAPLDDLGRAYWRP